MKAKIDNFMQNKFGIPYLKLTRDFSIHERCKYLVYNLNNIEKGLDKISIIDVGCGSGMVLRYISEMPFVDRYTGIDLNAERHLVRYKDLRTKFPFDFKNIDIDSSWSFGRNFDVAWSSEVLEHLIDDEGALKKIANTVKFGGLIILTMPSLKFIQRVGASLPSVTKISKTQDGGHVRLGYSIDDIKRLAKVSGLDLLRVDGISRSDVSRMRRLYQSSNVTKIADNLRVAFFSKEADHFVIGDDYNDRHEDFQSIGAVLRVFH